MYVHIHSFRVKEGEEETFIQMQRFEEKLDAESAGLNHFHIFKDRNEKNKYWILEYWNKKEDKDKLEDNENHILFHKMRDCIVDEKGEVYQCDVIV